VCPRCSHRLDLCWRYAQGPGGQRTPCLLTCWGIGRALHQAAWRRTGGACARLAMAASLLSLSSTCTIVCSRGPRGAGTRGGWSMERSSSSRLSILEHGGEQQQQQQPPLHTGAWRGAAAAAAAASPYWSMERSSSSSSSRLSILEHGEDLCPRCSHRLEHGVGPCSRGARTRWPSGA
jgi:hypothetical protein